MSVPLPFRHTIIPIDVRRGVAIHRRTQYHISRNRAVLLVVCSVLIFSLRIRALLLFCSFLFFFFFNLTYSRWTSSLPSCMWSQRIFRSLPGSRLTIFYRMQVQHWYFHHAHFIPIVGVGKRGVYLLVHGDLSRQHSFGTTLRFTGPVPADSRQ